MKTILKALCLLALIALSAILLAACSRETKPAANLKPYPLTTCLTDGEKLGSMGAPHVFAYEGREIKLCCSGCEDDFKKNAAKYVKQLEVAEAKAIK